MAYFFKRREKTGAVHDCASFEMHWSCFHSRTRNKEKLLNVNRDVAATWQTSRSFDRDGKNSEIRPEISVLTLRLKRSSKVSSKVLKTIYCLPRYIFIYMLHNLDFKNIFLWLGFSHFFAMLYFFSFLFFPTRRVSSGSAYTRHVAWNLHYACAHWSFQNSGRCTCMPHGMFVEVSSPANRRSRHWLLGKKFKEA